jgi:hypothetical protein
LEELPNDKSMNLVNVFFGTKMERRPRLFIFPRPGYVVNVCCVLCIVYSLLQNYKYSGLHICERSGLGFQKGICQRTWSSNKNIHDQAFARELG